MRSFILLTLAVLSLVCVPALRAQPDENIQRRIFELTNQDRVARGLQPLHWDAALAAAALAHADIMAREPVLSHQYPGEPDLTTRAAKAGAHFQAIAENVALGPTAAAVENAWMHSTPHRTNILNPRMNALGVGVAERDGSIYAAEDFAEASEALSQQQIEQRVRELLRAQNIKPLEPAAAAEQECMPGRPVPPAVRSIVRFQTPDLTQLPAQVVQQIRSGHFTCAAVGACAPDGSQGEFTVYRVVILFY